MKIIKIESYLITDDHYILVSDSEIKEACYVYKNDDNVYNTGIFYLPDDTDFTAFNENKNISKITYSTIPMLYTKQSSLDKLIEIVNNK